MKACAKCGRLESSYDTHCLCGHRYDDPAPAPKQPEVAAVAEAASLPVPDYAAPRSEIVAPENPKVQQELILGALTLLIVVVGGVSIALVTLDFNVPRMLGNGVSAAVVAYVCSFLLSLLMPKAFRFRGRLTLFLVISTVLITTRVVQQIDEANAAEARMQYLKNRPITF